ncbi:hypothetical protein O9G_002467 [Rozella allomycis CSF55]|uniref:U1-type domain-containing protein n=1 Tax=Rozella allomycis (strain CSF55) TaxID=988480 RepID=A0A075AZ98_ROZAC|nr:hypothetical protein O9G_002467 [Rozella allomycis CSF55]|eukprot:EPZ33904.1 hypothetical protein O9G_002467 [Rozella allomycis CSF55]
MWRIQFFHSTGYRKQNITVNTTIQLHNSGRKHKENVEKFLSDVRKKTKEEIKQQNIAKAIIEGKDLDDQEERISKTKKTKKKLVPVKEKTPLVIGHIPGMPEIDKNDWQTIPTEHELVLPINEDVVVDTNVANPDNTQEPENDTMVPKIKDVDDEEFDDSAYSFKVTEKVLSADADENTSNTIPILTME